MFKINSMKYKAILKTVSLALVFIFALSSLCACSSSIDEKKVVGKVGDFDVCYDELYFLASSYKLGLEAKYGEYSTLSAADAKKFDDELRELVYTNIVTNYAILSLCETEDLTIENSDLDDRVDDYMDKTIESEFGGKSEYKKNLKEYGLTDRYVRFTAAVDLLYSDLMIEMLEDKNMEDDEDKLIEMIKEEFIRTLHIMISNDTGEDVEANRAKAEEALSKLRDGSMTMYEVIKYYSEDLSLVDFDGIYFVQDTYLTDEYKNSPKYGALTKEYETAAFELSVGEISDVIESPVTNANSKNVTGYYIIKRLELEDEYIESNLLALREVYYKSMVYSELNKSLDEVREELKFVPNELGKSLDLATVEASISVAATVRLVAIISVCVLLAGGITAVVIVIVKKKKNKKALTVKK